MRLTADHTNIFLIWKDEKKPSKEILKDIDVIILDLQDVGVRFYTYASFTM